MELLDVEEAIVIEKNNGLLYSRKCAFGNIILSILILAVIINGIFLDSLSHYHGQTEFGFSGIFRSETVGYFDCGWGIYEAHFEKDGQVSSSGRQTWYYGQTECLRLTNGQDVAYNCDWFKNPDRSGLIWCICNIAGCMFIFMALLLHILSLFKNKTSAALYNKRRLFKITFCLSLCSGISILFAIVYWFRVNEKHNGCWNDGYQYIVASDDSKTWANYEWYQFDEKVMGDSMICDIGAVAVIWILAFFYLFVSCGCCTVCGMEEQCETKTMHNDAVEMLVQQDGEDEGILKEYSELDGE